METVHELKTWPKEFQAIKSGEKTFEIRRDDRKYQVGDFLELKEWEPTGYSTVCPNCMTGKYTGDSVRVRIKYILKPYNNKVAHAFGIMPNYCIMSIELMEGLAVN